MIDLNRVVERFDHNAAAIAALCRGVPADEARWRRDPEAWSLLEVVNHLADEERDDFRTRVDYALHRPGEAWPPIDPEGWVTARDYQARDWAASVEDFLAERRRSLTWLRELDAPDWDRAWEHPRAGSLRARDVLASWLAHDQLHLRQIARIHHDRAGETTRGGSTAYAGGW